MKRLFGYALLCGIVCGSIFIFYVPSVYHGSISAGSGQPYQASFLTSCKWLMRAVFSLLQLVRYVPQAFFQLYGAHTPGGPLMCFILLATFSASIVCLLLFLKNNH